MLQLELANLLVGLRLWGAIVTLTLSIPLLWCSGIPAHLLHCTLLCQVRLRQWSQAVMILNKVLERTQVSLSKRLSMKECNGRGIKPCCAFLPMIQDAASAGLESLTIDVEA
jgi:hypothetical protein